MKKFFAIAACVLAVAACNKMPDPNNQAGVSKAIRIDPVMTRATATAFENGDAIGLTVTRATGAYATNQKMTYNGLEFTSSLDWYAEGSEAATLAAYYPYAQAVPTSFTVATDQSNGTSSSDFIAAIKENVLPTANAVTMPFKHKLCRIVINVTNNAGYDLGNMVISGAIPTAVIAADYSATADEDEDKADITAHKAETPAAGDATYEVILPPQTATLSLSLNASGVPMQQNLAEATLEAGKQYSVSVVVNQASLDVILAGTIEDWASGGELPAAGAPEVQFEENLDQGYFTYDNVQYSVVKMADDKWWMAQNLAYLPAGKEAATDLTAVTAGVFAPLVLNAGHTALEFSTSADVIAANGYLYQAEVALGLEVGGLTSVEDAQALEGAQGICPAGWHIPTLNDIVGLVGKSVGATTNTEAPYYDGANGSIVMLNNAGFNMDAFGAISIQDNTKTAGTFMGWASGYPDKISSGMFCGSSYAGVTYNTSGDPSTGIKNLQFYGFMPMTNKATEAEYTCNGTKVSYRIAGPVRCVRN